MNVQARHDERRYNIGRRRFGAALALVTTMTLALTGVGCSDLMGELGRVDLDPGEVVYLTTSSGDTIRLDIVEGGIDLGGDGVADAVFVADETDEATGTYALDFDGDGEPDMYLFVAATTVSATNTLPSQGGDGGGESVPGDRLATVTFDAGDGTPSRSSISVAFGRPYGVLPTATRTGYAFAGWYANTDGSGTRIAGETEVATEGAHTLYAAWTPTEYAITYNLDDGTNAGGNPATYTVETPTIILADPTKAGYTFAGWFAEATFSTVVTEIALGSAGDVTIYAKWTVNNNTIAFDTNGGSGTMSPQTIATDASANLTANTFTRAGYTFAGWATSAESTVAYADEASYEMGTTGVTLYAVWTLVTYNIEYTLDDGTNAGANPATYTIETATIALADPTKAGYTFAGWYTEATFTTQVTQIAQGSTGNVSLYAKWTPTEYTITYDLDGGTNAGENPGTYTIETATITLADPTKAGYTFNGWFAEATFTTQVTQIVLGSIGNVTIYAKWLADNTITATVNLGTAESITFDPASASVAKGSTLSVAATSIADATYAWYLDGAVVAGQPTATFSIATADMVAKQYELFLLVTKDGVGSSGSCTVTVTN